MPERIHRALVSKVDAISSDSDRVFLPSVCPSSKAMRLKIMSRRGDL